MTGIQKFPFYRGFFVFLFLHVVHSERVRWNFIINFLFFLMIINIFLSAVPPSLCSRLSGRFHDRTILSFNFQYYLCIHGWYYLKFFKPLYVQIFPTVFILRFTLTFQIVYCPHFWILKNYSPPHVFFLFLLKFLTYHFSFFVLIYVNFHCTSMWIRYTKLSKMFSISQMLFLACVWIISFSSNLTEFLIFFLMAWIQFPKTAQLLCNINLLIW